MHPAVALWIIGIVLVSASWYVPNSGGLFWLGALTLLIGAAIALKGSQDDLK